jgi:hypothetical protein
MRIADENNVRMSRLPLYEHILAALVLLVSEHLVCSKKTDDEDRIEDYELYQDSYLFTHNLDQNWK